MQEYRDFILDRHGRMKEIRAVEEPHWREIAAYIRPDDRDFDAHVQRRRDDSPIFDISPLLALDDFEGGFFTNATNPQNRWMELSTGDEDLDKFQPVKAWLWRRSNNVLASFSPAVSPFYAEAPDWYAHIGAFGWGGFYCEEIIGQGAFNDRAIPINESFIDRNAAGRVDTYHREFSLTGRQAKNKFKDNAAIGKMRDEDRAVFVHGVWPNPEFRPGKLGPMGMPFVAGYVSPDLRDFYRQDGYYEFPYGCPGWKRRSGRPYPTGPGHTARADIVMVNEMERSNLVAAQFSAEPALLAHDKSKVLAADVEPNAILYGTINPENGKPILSTLERHQNLPVSVEMAEQKRNVIRQAFRWGLSQLIAQRLDLQLMGPGLVRVQSEGLSVLVARRYNMLDRAGLFDGDPPPQELVGKPIAIKYVSPLAKMMKVSEAQGTMQFINALLPLGQARPDIWDGVNLDNAVIVVHDGFTSDPSLLTDPRQRDAVRAQRAAQQEAFAKLQAAEQAANIHATVAHANQAQTLSTQRAQQ
jgi:hypothetical protein